MSYTGFEIKIIRQSWIKDDKEDLCSHGEVYIRIGSEELSNKELGSWALSAAGLYLLRSLGQDCGLDEFSNQLVPCCGHFMIPNENGQNYVVILGCAEGVDWKIYHSNEEVIFESKKGTKGKLSFDEYKIKVLNFTDEIEKFYGDPNDKIVSDEDFYRNGYKQFWTEWFELKNKWKIE